jgi:hypothetical protein
MSGAESSGCLESRIGADTGALSLRDSREDTMRLNHIGAGRIELRDFRPLTSGIPFVRGRNPDRIRPQA